MASLSSCFKKGLLSVALVFTGTSIVTGAQPVPPTSYQPAHPTSTQPPPPISTQPAPPTSTRSAPSRNSKPAPPTSLRRSTQGEFLPDLSISRYDWKPVPPNRKEPVDVRVIVNNKGRKGSGPFTVQWWPGENFSQPACTWRIENLQIKESRSLHCSGYIYPSWYGKIRMAVIVDSDHEVKELDEGNNKLYRETQVNK